MMLRQGSRLPVAPVFAICLVALLGLHACRAGSGSGRVSYTPLGVAQVTLSADVPTVVQAVDKALATLDMPVREVRRVEEGGQAVRTEIVAAARDRRVSVTVERVAGARTRVAAEVREFLLPDRATAAAIVEQVRQNVGQ